MSSKGVLQVVQFLEKRSGFRRAAAQLERTLLLRQEESTAQFQLTRKKEKIKKIKHKLFHEKNARGLREFADQRNMLWRAMKLAAKPAASAAGACVRMQQARGAGIPGAMIRCRKQGQNTREHESPWRLRLICTYNGISAFGSSSFATLRFLRHFPREVACLQGLTVDESAFGRSFSSSLFRRSFWSLLVKRRV